MAVLQLFTLISHLCNLWGKVKMCTQIIGIMIIGGSFVVRERIQKLLHSKEYWSVGMGTFHLFTKIFIFILRKFLFFKRLPKRFLPLTFPKNTLPFFSFSMYFHVCLIVFLALFFF